MADKEWDPDEPDPVELQKEQLAMGKEFLARLKKADEEEAKRRAEEEEYRARPPVQALGAYKPPTPEQVADVFKKAWDKTKEIMPDAPERVQLHAFQGLVSAFAPPATFGSM